jgi:hypothetical protein
LERDEDSWLKQRQKGMGEKNSICLLQHLLGWIAPLLLGWKAPAFGNTF